MTTPRRRAGRACRLRRIVALGGGTGLPAVLMGLRRHLPRSSRITAVVTAVDDGGSSGILRKEYGVLPPGDIRNCLVALARQAPPEVTAALQCRLSVSSGPDHAVGNLLLTALDLVSADEIAAIRFVGALLQIKDVVLPSTTTRAHLVAELADGGRVRGESAIPQSKSRVLRLSIDPPDARPAPGVLDAIRGADAIIIGPGSLYTSVLATLVVPGIAEALATASGLKLFVCNLMTEPGETDGYGVAAHLEALAAHGLPAEALDYIIINNGTIPPRCLSRYLADGAEPVRADVADAPGRPAIVTANLVAAGSVIRHESDKLGLALCAVFGARGMTRAAGPHTRSSRDRHAAAPGVSPVPVPAPTM